MMKSVSYIIPTLQGNMKKDNILLEHYFKVRIIFSVLPQVWEITAEQSRDYPEINGSSLSKRSESTEHRWLEKEKPVEGKKKEKRDRQAGKCSVGDLNPFWQSTEEQVRKSRPVRPMLGLAALSGVLYSIWHRHKGLQDKKYNSDGDNQDAKSNYQTWKENPPCFLGIPLVSQVLVSKWWKCPTSQMIELWLSSV